MVQMVDVEGMLSLIERRGIETFLRELAEFIREDFGRWPSFEKVPRLACHSADGVIELMPASDGRTYAFKYVNGHPVNTRSGKLTVTAFGVLADVATGYPLLLCEMTILTALRTAATSALAARYLARPDSRTMALIGAGAQAEFQALAFKALLGIESIRYHDLDPAAMRKFELNLAGRGLELIPCSSAAEAAAGADIITTATAAKTRAAVLDRSMVAAGSHINAIGGDCPGKTEISVDILRDARLVVEYEPQTRVEGEIQQLPPSATVTELWSIVAGDSPGRACRDELTLFDSVGFAVEDFASLRYVLHIAARHGGVPHIDLVPTLPDPRDLFGPIGRRSACAA